MIKYNPVPKAGPVFQPKLSHKCTTVEPFTFESKDEEIKRKRAELRQKVEEEERKVCLTPPHYRFSSLEFPSNTAL